MELDYPIENSEPLSNTPHTSKLTAHDTAKRSGINLGTNQARISLTSLIIRVMVFQPDVYVWQKCDVVESRLFFLLPSTNKLRRVFLVHMFELYIIYCSKSLSNDLIRIYVRCNG